MCLIVLRLYSTRGRAAAVEAPGRPVDATRGRGWGSSPRAGTRGAAAPPPAGRAEVEQAHTAVAHLAAARQPGLGPPGGRETVLAGALRQSGTALSRSY